MRLLSYLAVALVAGIIGYKLAQVYMTNNQVNKNVLPIVDNLKSEYSSLVKKLSSIQLSEADKVALNTRKDEIIGLLSNFYGYTKAEIQKIIGQ